MDYQDVKNLPNTSTYEPSSTEDTSKLTGKNKKAHKKQIYKQNHPEPQQTQRRILKEIYIDVKDPEEKNLLLKEAAFSTFDGFENPFLGFLDLYERLHDVAFSKTNSLAGIFVQLFGKWLEKNPDCEDIYNKYLTPDTQKKAIEILTAHHSHHVANGIKTFKLTEADATAIIKNQIITLAKENKFKEAMELAVQFNLKEEYPFELFLLPRIFQDALADVRNYCRDMPDLQRKLIGFYDSHIYKDDQRIQAELKLYCKENNIINNFVEKITANSVTKNIKTLILEYDLEKYEQDIAPNHRWFAREKSINYTVKRRFLNHLSHYPALDHTSYVSSIKGYLDGTEIGRKVQFIKLLWCSGHSDQRRDALAWIQIFNVPRWNIPSAIDCYMRENPKIVEQVIIDVTNDRQVEDLNNLSVDGTPIVIIDNESDLENLMKKLTAEEIIGIDSEWKPQYLAKMDEVALLQIAVSGCVYLVDFVVLEKSLSSAQWELFFKSLLHCEGIKLGFDFINDLRALFHSPTTKEFKSFATDNKNCVCIKILVENLLEVDPEFIDLSDHTAPKESDSNESTDSIGKPVSFKLSTLCEKFLGINLDKSQQCSDWANRPLTSNQVVYAALDAHILLRLFSEIKKIALEKGLNFENIVQNSLSNCTKKERTKAKKAVKKKLDDMTWTELVEKINCAVVEKHGSVPAQAFKCVVDLMLLGLGKHLRRCGVDTKIPTSSQELISIIGSDLNRTIITSGKSAEQLRVQFPNRVLIIQNASAMDPIQQLKFVVSKTKITVSKDDIFVRCKECNSIGFLHVPGLVLQALFQSAVVCANVYHDAPFDIKGWKKKLSKLDQSEYYGYGCSICPSDEYFQVNVHQGRIDIIRNLAIHISSDSYTTTNIKNIPDTVVKNVKLFYICGNCGKIYYDGSHEKNYLNKLGDIVTDNDLNTTYSPEEISGR